MKKYNDIKELQRQFITEPIDKKYFLSNDEIWLNNLKNIKKYIDENNKRPSSHDINKEIRSYGEWMVKQQMNYNKKKCIMNDEKIRKQWEEFINNNKYNQYL